MPWTTRKAKCGGGRGWKAWMVRKLHFLMQPSLTRARYFFTELSGTSFMILPQNREKEAVCILLTASFSLPLLCTKLESRTFWPQRVASLWNCSTNEKKNNIPHLSREVSSQVLLSELVRLTFTVCRWCSKCGWKLRWPHKPWGVSLQTAISLRLAWCVMTHQRLHSGTSPGLVGWVPGHVAENHFVYQWSTKCLLKG